VFISGKSSMSLDGKKPFQSLLTSEEIDIFYNEHFHDILRKDEMDPASFVFDKMSKIFYPRETGILASIKRKFVLSIFDAFIQVVPYDQMKYTTVMQQIMDNPKNTFLASNHGTFANLATIAREFYRNASPSGHPEKKDKIFTFIAPSLTTQKQWYLISTFSHLLKTFTLNDKSKIEKLKGEVQEVREGFKEEINRHAKKQWNIFGLAPEGTRNALLRNSQGGVDKIYMEKNLNVIATRRFLRSFIENGDALVLQGVNDAGLKMPGKTNPLDHTRNKGRVYTDIEFLSKKDALDIIGSDKFLERIAELTRDKYGNSIGEVVSAEQMKEIKAQLKANPTVIESYPEEDFEDTIIKATVRRLFNAFKYSL